MRTSLEFYAVTSTRRARMSPSHFGLRAWPALGFLLVTLLAAGTASAAQPGDDSASLLEKLKKKLEAWDSALPITYSCMFCHGDPEIMTDNKEHLRVSEEDLYSDVHWQKGLRCHDCHGGSPNLGEFTSHDADPGFQPLSTPADIPSFCGRCHSDLEYMRRYSPTARTDQEAEYRTSGHGQRLEELDDPTQAKVATCIDCHGRHGILAVSDQQSPVYPSNVAKTCARCHSDAGLMAGRSYRGVPLRHDQFERWQGSVHGKAMLEKGDLSAPTCNDCHGNHGALPPGVKSVANACGSCHGKVASLFFETSMKHSFEEFGLPGCATCHGHHKMLSPSDEMLGMGDRGVCHDCHRETGGKLGATLDGVEVAGKLRGGLKQLQREIAVAEEMIVEAERLGMPVRGPRFDLRQAFDSLTNARSLVHSFSVERVEEALGEGLKVTEDVRRSAQAALDEHTHRRIWLAGSLVPILTVVVLLVFYIRVTPISSEL